jgi:AcrR family transcriptional regulator
MGLAPTNGDVEDLQRRLRVLEMENDVLRRIASFYAGREISPSEAALELMTAERRSPFADNPTVGVRGTMTQQKIVRAAMQVFAEVDYRACSVEQISEAAGCSRSSFYQYFSSKDDLFRRVARELSRSLYVITEGSESITTGAGGRQAILVWLQKFGSLFDEYSPMFDAFETVAGVDSDVAARGEWVMARQAELLVGRFADDAFEDVDPTAAVTRLITTVIRTFRWWHLLRALGKIADIGRERIDDALADVIHRIAFGPRPGVNVRATDSATPESGRFELMALDDVPWGAPRRERSRAQSQTRDRLVDAGRAVFTRLGFHNTRIDDVVLAAGSSHGTFYRYFDSKQDLFRIIALRAARRLARSVEQIPDLGPTSTSGHDDRDAELRRWLEAFVAVSNESAPITTEWVDALSGDVELRNVAMTAAEWFRRRLAVFLEPRQFGDVDADALVLVALLTNAVHRQPPGQEDDQHDEDDGTTLLAMLYRGFLGRDVPAF